MEARVASQDGVFVVTLSGQLDFESADSLRATCRRLFREKKVIFNLAKLNFVGSSGLTPFLELLGEMNKSHGRDIKLCSVSSEFVRLFEAGELYGLEIYDSENNAKLAFTGSGIHVGTASGGAGGTAGVGAASPARFIGSSITPTIEGDDEDVESDAGGKSDALIGENGEPRAQSPSGNSQSTSGGSQNGAGPFGAGGSNTSAFAIDKVQPFGLDYPMEEDGE